MEKTNSQQPYMADASAIRDRVEAMFLTILDELGKLKELSPYRRNLVVGFNRPLRKAIMEWHFEPTEENGTSS